VLNRFCGYADTVSVDPNLDVPAHSRVGKKQLGIPADLKLLRRNYEKRQPELAAFVHPDLQQRVPMKSRNEVVALVRAKIRLLHFALSTEVSYCGWVARYYDFCRKLPPKLSHEKKAEAFLTDLALRLQVAAKTQNQAFAALLFLYEHVLNQPLEGVDALRAKQPVHERTAPSRDQVRALRSAVRDTPAAPNRLLVDLLYGCGLRVSEPLELRIKEVLWEEGPTGQLVIRGAKGGKDRRVPIPAICAQPLRRQIERAHNIWESDRAHFKDVGVTLTHQLAAKYPSARFSWQWFWVFPAAGHCNHPRTGERVRYHLLADSLQRAVQAAARRIGLDGLITPHVLRHAYATHSRESIDALRVLMGHVSIETTAGPQRQSHFRGDDNYTSLVG
jgi:integrase